MSIARSTSIDETSNAGLVSGGDGGNASMRGDVIDNTTDLSSIAMLNAFLPDIASFQMTTMSPTTTNEADAAAAATTSTANASATTPTSATSISSLNPSIVDEHNFASVSMLFFHYYFCFFFYLFLVSKQKVEIIFVI